MPDSDGGSERGDYERQQDERSDKRSEASIPDVRKEPSAVSSATAPAAARRSPAPPVQGGWSRRLHFLMLGTLATSVVCMIIITATRSWGVGKVVDLDLSAGLWEVCSRAGCDGWSVFCDEASGRVSAAGAFSIMTILLLVLMVVLQLFEFLRPGTLVFFPKVQAVLSHVLWLFLLIAWSLWAGAHNGTNCAEEFFGAKYPAKFNDHLYYAWGWMFVLWMWIVHMVIAVLLTLKVFIGKPLPCGL